MPTGKMTGGFFQTLLYAQIDMLTYTSEIARNFIIRYADYPQSSGVQILRSFPILLLIFRIIMLGSIQFYDQPGIVTIEVNNVIVNYFLTKEANRVGSQKVIP